MTHEPAGASDAAARLLRALEAGDALDHTQARELLPDFAEAEAAGADVDARPEFAALLRHLDGCAECTALYAELAAELEALLLDQPAPMPALPAPPTFFAPPARQSDNVALRVLRGLRRAFELDLRVQLPTPGTLSGGQSANLFADTLPEVGGAPLLAVSLVPGPAGGAPAVLVALRETGAATRWEVQLTTQAGSRAATTDAQGLARFERLPLAQGERIQLSCRALA